MKSNPSEKRSNSPYNQNYERMDNSEEPRSNLNNNVPAKKRIIVFNKADLANHHLQSKVIQYFNARNQPIMYLMANGSGGESRDPSNIIKLAVSVLKKFSTQNDNNSTEGSVNDSEKGKEESSKKKYAHIQKVYSMMVVGIPNVGKSSIINRIRLSAGKGKSAISGPLPGVTKKVTGFRVNDNPPIYLVDTPGVMPPGNVEDHEQALKLALTGAVKETIVSDYVLADYLLFTLNKFRSTIYVEHFELPSPCDNIEEVLAGVSKKLKLPNSNGTLDLNAAAKIFVSLYRKGGLGKLTIDQVPSTPMFYLDNNEGPK